ncbi:hypothetical protein [Burkholderia sp. BCC0044]|uniref:hypothetical protein n=1 Tax=Burkholderia sp. BCC0044 TaxID=2676295 RepID=UPI00158B4194|nr:hypothetical protein [Burkholderia sp. BCC0044]
MVVADVGGIPSRLLSSSAMPGESQAKHGIFIIETLIIRSVSVARHMVVRVDADLFFSIYLIRIAKLKMYIQRKNETHVDFILCHVIRPSEEKIP